MKEKKITRKIETKGYGLIWLDSDDSAEVVVALFIVRDEFISI